MFARMLKFLRRGGPEQKQASNIDEVRRSERAAVKRRQREHSRDRDRWPSGWSPEMIADRGELVQHALNPLTIDLFRTWRFKAYKVDGGFSRVVVEIKRQHKDKVFKFPTVATLHVDLNGHADLYLAEGTLHFDNEYDRHAIQIAFSHAENTLEILRSRER